MSLRASGILLHISSLPSRFGIGDMGPAAYAFADFLADTKQSYWQIIPLTPPNPRHYSPYHSPSAFAGNPLFVSPEILVQDGLIDQSDLEDCPQFPEDRVDFPAVMEFRNGLLRRAYERFRDREPSHEYHAFREAESAWLDDYCLFHALSVRYQDRPWNEWPEDLRDRRPDALRIAADELRDEIDMQVFVQFTFFKQWDALKTYCNSRGIKIFGDLPVYVDFNSADVWTHPHFFKLDDAKSPYVAAGVPPDYFSATGQLWGLPIYNWDALKDAGYSWWLERIRHNMRLCDLLRIDHFRGFVGYWEVPASETTALNGRWITGPGSDFFRAVLKRFPSLPIIAEDLGEITPDVRELMHEFGFPGMKILLFAFGEDCPTNPYAPHNVPKNSVVYTGTHDNNTVRGWFRDEAGPDEIDRLSQYVGRSVSEEDVAWEMCRLALMTSADTAVLPLQDVLGLGGEARMNLPSQKKGNWLWRLAPKLQTDETADRLRRLTVLYGRA